MYPLRFEPLFRNYLWGGRKLGTLLHKPIGEEEHYAESWEVVDHDDDQSRVAHGPLAGATLGQLVNERGAELLGRHHPLPRFPLLLKYLDAQKNLSVQVHPNDTQAARLDPPDLGKTEAWVILHAEPGSQIYAGLKKGFDRHAFEREVNRGTSELCLHSFQPQPGDCVFIPAGIVHAIGAGIVLAEIQQASDVTYRVYDWKRVGADGQPRPLHIAEALEVIDYQTGPVKPVSPQPTDKPHVEVLVDCEKFALKRWKFTEPQSIGGDERFHIITVLSGSLHLENDPVEAPLGLAQTALLPASCGELKLEPSGSVTLLEAHLP